MHNARSITLFWNSTRKGGWRLCRQPTNLYLDRRISKMKLILILWKIQYFYILKFLPWSWGIPYSSSIISKNKSDVFLRDSTLSVSSLICCVNFSFCCFNSIFSFTMCVRISSWVWIFALNSDSISCNSLGAWIVRRCWPFRYSSAPISSPSLSPTWRVYWPLAVWGQVGLT